MSNLTPKTESDSTGAVSTKEERPLAEGAGYRRYAPRTDIRETADAYVLLTDVPGLAEDSVDVRLEDGILSIRGRAKWANRADREAYFGEYGPREYHRSFQLPEGVDHGKIGASLKDGVLTVTLPKAEALRPRKIEVKNA